MRRVDDEIPFEVPDGWAWCRLGEIAYVASGSTPQQSEFVPNGIPYIKMYNLRNQKIDFDFKPQYIKRETHESKLKRSQTEVGDLIMNIVGPPLGKLAFIPESLPEANFNQAAVLIRPYYKKELLNKYLFYFLSEMSEINSISTKGSAGQVNISLTQAQNMKIPLPPLTEQKVIVAKIEEIFAQIDILENNKIDLQTTIKHAKSKVLDLAIHGKLVPQDPNDEPAGKLLEKIRSESKNATDNRHYQNIEKEPFVIPDNWCWCKLGDICDLKGGKRIPSGMSATTEKTNHIYIRVTDMQNYSISDNDLRYISDEIFNIIKNYTISKDDLYLTIAGTIGRVGEVPEKFGGQNLTENALKLTNIKIDKKYLMFALESDYIQNYFESTYHQVAMPKLSLLNASKSIFPLPPLAEQKRIVEKIESLFSILDQITENLS